MTIQDRQHELLPEVDEIWSLKNDKLVRITGVSDGVISGTIITKYGWMGMEWDMSGKRKPSNHSGTDLCEMIEKDGK
jgi:hypothetical protein